MNKSKDKHHPPEEAKKNAKATDVPAPAGGEPVKETPSDQKEQAAPGPASSEARLQKAAQEIDQLKDQLLRARADFDNYRKRALREKGEIYENANEALMLELLPIIDHLQLAINSAKEHKANIAFQEGLQLTADQFMTVLSKFGLDPFSSDKKQFDPNLHEAISYLPSEIEPEGTILVQSRQGYRFKNKILRPAQVVVSSGPLKPEPPKAHDQPLEE